MRYIVCNTSGIEKGKKGLIKRKKSELNIINNLHAKRKVYLLSIFIARESNEILYFTAWLLCASSSVQGSRVKESNSTWSKESFLYKPSWTLRQEPLPIFPKVPPACFHPLLGHEQGGRWRCFSQHRLFQTTPRSCASQSSFSLWFPL